MSFRMPFGIEVRAKVLDLETACQFNQLSTMHQMQHLETIVQVSSTFSNRLLLKLKF